MHEGGGLQFQRRRSQQLLWLPLEHLNRNVGHEFILIRTIQSLIIAHRLGLMQITIQL